MVFRALLKIFSKKSKPGSTATRATMALGQHCNKGNKATGQSENRATGQPENRATKQQGIKETVQQGNKATEQQVNRGTRQQGNEATRHGLHGLHTLEN